MCLRPVDTFLWWFSNRVGFDSSTTIGLVEPERWNVLLRRYTPSLRFHDLVDLIFATCVSPFRLRFIWDFLVTFDIVCVENDLTVTIRRPFCRLQIVTVWPEAHQVVNEDDAHASAPALQVSPLGQILSKKRGGGKRKRGDSRSLQPPRNPSTSTRFQAMHIRYSIITPTIITQLCSCIATYLWTGCGFDSIIRGGCLWLVVVGGWFGFVWSRTGWALLSLSRIWICSNAGPVRCIDLRILEFEIYIWW